MKVASRLSGLTSPLEDNPHHTDTLASLFLCYAWIFGCPVQTIVSIDSTFKFEVLDFKLSPCSECCMLSCG